MNEPIDQTDPHIDPGAAGTAPDTASQISALPEPVQQRNIILTQTTNDLTNLLNSVNLPVLILSNELHIRHFTPPTQRLMNLRAADIGRPFSDIRLNIEAGDLRPVLSEVIETLTPREMEVRDKEGHWYLFRVRPYRTTENKIAGLVVVLLDIDQLRRSEHELRAARDFSRAVIESVPLPLAVTDLDFKIRAVNGAFRALACAGKDDMDRRSLLDVAEAMWGFSVPLRAQLEELRRSKDYGKKFEFEHRTHGESPQTLYVRGCVLQPGGEMFLLVTVEDITAHREAERLLAATSQELGKTRDELRALAASLFTSQEDESRRVARELHDDICQKLAALEMDTQQIGGLIGSNSKKAAGGLEKVNAAIGDLAENVRQISHMLHPSAIEDLGITSAMKALAAEFQEREQMIVTFSAENLPKGLPVNVATGLYRITQEALRNIAKHAGKTHVKIVLKGSSSGIRLQVTDHGNGFDTQAARRGLGLVSMAERARMMEGAFSVESKPGEGARVTVDVPYPTQA
jgi:two-component system, chemotaxis family, CheB/CheR fusion protein